MDERLGVFPANGLSSGAIRSQSGRARDDDLNPHDGRGHHMKFWGGWRRQKAHDLKEVLFGHCVAHSGAFGSSSSSSSIIELSASSFSICMGGCRQYGRDQRTKEKRGERETVCAREEEHLRQRSR